MDDGDLSRLQAIFDILCDLIYIHDGSYWDADHFESCEHASFCLHDARDCIRVVCSEMFSCELHEV